MKPRLIRYFKTREEELSAVFNTPPGTCWRCGNRFPTLSPRNMCTPCLRDLYGTSALDWVMAIFMFSSPREEPFVGKWHWVREFIGVTFWILLMAGILTFINIRRYHGG